MEITFMLLSLIMSSLTMSIYHPISFMGIILIQAMTICIISSLIIPTPWLAIVLFLIFLGGVMVLFIYMSSLASNENFLVNYNKSMMLIAFSVFLMIMLIYLNQPSILLINNKGLLFTSSLYMMKMQNMFIVMIFYLLFTLIVVSKVIKKNKAPMRSLK